MKKEKVYNEAVSGDEGFTPGDGYPSCDGEPCANVSDETDEATDTLADGEPAAEADAAKALEEAVAQWQDKYVRLQAEFDNYRKRTLKEKMDLVQTGGRDVLLFIYLLYPKLADVFLRARTAPATETQQVGEEEFNPYAPIRVVPNDYEE